MHRASATHGLAAGPAARSPGAARAARSPGAARAAGSGGKAGSGGGRARPRRGEVTFLKPGKAPLRFKQLTQQWLDDYLRTAGAVGFATDEGSVSRSLEDLPDGGTVELVMEDEPPLATQVRNLQKAADNRTRAMELQLGGYLRKLASTENAGCTITVLPTAPFKGAYRQDYVQLDAAVVANHTLYLGEHKCVLGVESVDDLEDKVHRIRTALTRGTSPDLAAALQGVSHVKLFLAGEGVWEGLAVQELTQAATAAGVSVVLPSAEGLDIVGPAATPLQL